MSYVLCVMCYVLCVMQPLSNPPYSNHCVCAGVTGAFPPPSLPIHCYMASQLLTIGQQAIAVGGSIQSYVTSSIDCTHTHTHATFSYLPHVMHDRWLTEIKGLNASADHDSKTTTEALQRLQRLKPTSVAAHTKREQERPCMILCTTYTYSLCDMHIPILL